jgi:hypothetical protein
VEVVAELPLEVVAEPPLDVEQVFFVSTSTEDSSIRLVNVLKGG